MRIIKMKLFAMAFMVLLSGILSSLDARPHSPHVTVQPLGYYFLSSYKIYLLSYPHLLPLEVKLQAGRVSPPVPSIAAHKYVPIYNLKWHEGPFEGNVSFIIDQKLITIGFTKGKQKRLKIHKKQVSSSSIWYNPINNILENVYRYDRSAHKRRGLLYAASKKGVPSSFRIKPSRRCEMTAHYSLNQKSRSPLRFPDVSLDITIKQEVNQNNKKPMLITTAIFYPHKDSRAGYPFSILKYAISKDTMKEIMRKHIDRHHACWCIPVKKAVQHCVKQYFKLKRVHKKLDKTYINRKNEG